MSDTPIGIELRGVGHRFGRRVLFAKVDCTIRAGDVMVVVGQNGAGKSTLLKLVAGLLRPVAGEVLVTWGGQVLDFAARRQILGYMSPETQPYRPLTVRENLRFFSRVRGLAHWDESVVETLGLTDRLDQPVSELSSGYTQRVKLAVALLHRPPILILDEPGVTLDDRGQEQLSELVRRQRERGIALLAANVPRDVANGTRILRLGG